MRSYKAARRSHTREPVEFEVAYEVEELDEQSKPTGVYVDRVETFTCRGDISGLTLAAFAEASDVDVADIQPEHVALIKQVFTEAFGDAKEYGRFYRFARTHLDDEQLIDIIGDLIGDLTGRPTVRPSTSSDTSSPTGEPSRVVGLPGMAAKPVVVQDLSA